MTGPGCPKTKSGEYKKHTPYTSEKQTTAGRIALAAKKGKIPKSKLRGASKQMYKGMTEKELQSHSEETKGKNLPEKVARKKLEHKVQKRLDKVFKRGK